MFVYIKNWLQGQWKVLDDDGHVVQDGGSFPVPYKWLPDDILDADGNLISRKFHRNILGIVDFTNKTGFGFTSRNVPIYMFYPFHPGYPPFQVSSKTKYTSNMIASVSFEHWDMKYPRGGIQRILGPVGHTKTECDALLQSIHIPMPSTVSITEDTKTHEVASWDIVCNIDPEGCEDVDDVFSWRKVSDSVEEFAISIADVSAFVAEGSELDTIAMQKASTIYDANGVVVDPMLPLTISTQRASLRCDSSHRPVIALVCTIQNEMVVKKEWKLLKLAVCHSFTYDSVVLENTIYQTLVRYIRIVCGSIDPDPHKLVESAMIFYNSTVAQLLYENKQGLLRVHAGTMFPVLAQQTHLPELAWLGSTAGYYVFGNTTEDCRHNGLQLSVYTHASSPLRRYADLVNQRVLKHLVFGLTAPTIHPLLPHKLNERMKSIRHYERSVWFLKHIDVLHITKVEGYILGEKGDFVKIYVPVWKKCVKGKIQTPYNIGSRVLCSVYTNLESTNIEHRYIISASCVDPEESRS